jgi:UrcA family protein
MKIYLIVAALASTTAAPVLAGDAPRSQTVRYADLDLGRPEGRATLDRRIERAIRSVCAGPAGTATLYDAQATGRCVRLTRIEARRAADLAAAKTGRQADSTQLAGR